MQGSPALPGSGTSSPRDPPVISNNRHPRVRVRNTPRLTREQRDVSEAQWSHAVLHVDVRGAPAGSTGRLRRHHHLRRSEPRHHCHEARHHCSRNRPSLQTRHGCAHHPCCRVQQAGPLPLPAGHSHQRSPRWGGCVSPSHDDRPHTQGDKSAGRACADAKSRTSEATGGMFPTHHTVPNTSANGTEAGPSVRSVGSKERKYKLLGWMRATTNARTNLPCRCLTTQHAGQASTTACVGTTYEPSGS